MVICNNGSNLNENSVKKCCRSQTAPRLLAKNSKMFHTH